MTYSLYVNLLPQQSSLAYLCAPIRPSRYLNPIELINSNVNKVMAITNQLASVGINFKGLSQLLLSRFYSQIVRPQMEYGLAINRHNLKLINELEKFRVRLF